MSRITRKLPVTRSAAVVTVSLLALTTAAAGTASAADASRGRAADAGCQVFQGLSEVTTQMDAHDVAPEGTSAGDLAIYVDEITDGSGAHVAEVHGTAHMLYNRPSDGHLIGMWQEEVTFDGGGKALGIGITDVNQLFTGAPLVENFTGTGGKYLGWHGTRQWVRTSGDTADVTMTLCPAK